MLWPALIDPGFAQDRKIKAGGATVRDGSDNSTVGDNFALTFSGSEVIGVSFYERP